MAAPYPSSRQYRKDFEDAEAKFDNGDIDDCKEACNDNLIDPTLPRYYYIRNSILLVSAMDNWDDANLWRLAAEQAYITAFQDATRKEDKNSLSVLQDLREELDQWIEQRNQDIEEYMFGGREDDDDDDDDDDETDMEAEDDELDDSDEDMGGEREEDSIQAPAKESLLPIRSASEHETSQVPVIATPPVPSLGVEPTFYYQVLYEL